MASSSSVPAPEQFKFSSRRWRTSRRWSERSAATLRDIASVNSLLVLDCCSTVSRGGRRVWKNCWIISSLCLWKFAQHIMMPLILNIWQSLLKLHLLRSS